VEPLTSGTTSLKKYSPKSEDQNNSKLFQNRKKNQKSENKNIGNDGKLT